MNSISKIKLLIEKDKNIQEAKFKANLVSVNKKQAVILNLLNENKRN